MPQFGRGFGRRHHHGGITALFNAAIAITSKARAMPRYFDHQPDPERHAVFPGEQRFPSVNPSIRHRLEIEAWRQHPAFAAKQAARRHRQAPPRRRLRWQDRVLLIVGITLLSLVLVRIETAQAAQDQWGLQLDTPDASALQLALDTDIHVEISGLAARVEVRQQFENPSDGWAEGIYRFPLPGGAAVDQMRIEIGGRIIEGEIQERKTARRVYQQAKSDGFTASLVEQQKPNQFETRLANIGPGERIEVTIGFLVNVSFSEGTFSLRLPMTFTPRGGPADLTDNPPVPVLTSAAQRLDHRLSMEVLIHSSIGFASIESRYHDVEILPEPQGYRVVLDDPWARTDRDFELAWFPDLQAVPQSSLMTWDDGDAVYAQLMMLPPLPGAVEYQPRDVIFIIDTSGSMEGESIEQARSALSQGLQQLGGDDTFNLIQFNSHTELLFPSSVAVTPENLMIARAYIGSLVANGGTVMAPALHAAFRSPDRPGRLRQVVFITDGSVNNQQQLLTSIGRELADSRLFTVSIGSAPNSWFMRKAAEIGRGSHSHIGKLDEVAERMSRLWSQIRLSALSDICVDWGTDAEYYPEVIPDLYAGEPLWVVARLPMEPRQITVCGLLNGQDWEHSTAPFATRGNETLATLWARKKIEALEDGLVFGHDRDTVNKQVRQVALDYGLLTSQTSLVAVDRTPARIPGEALATGKVPNLLPAGSTTGVGFPQTATGWRAQVVLTFLTLLFATWMYWASARPKASTGPRRPLSAETGRPVDAAI
ncbi:MAG: marine proteobacterial sortase target protein [Gammaproteobacteria bacterium]|nr:marine proteobacterial sortase target protein [Gammaproteobacteria bacterium]